LFRISKFGFRASLMSNKSGIALITTLMIVALVVAVVVEFSRATVAEIEISKNFSDEKKITYIAISGITAVRDLLTIEGKFSKADSLLEDWAKSRVYFDSATGALEEGNLQGAIWDEESRINVNSLVGEKGGFEDTQKRIWERLLKQTRFGLTPDQVNTIIHGVKDWIDKDNEVTGIYGAEDAAYLQRGYHCKNAPLDTIEEMLLINGVTKEILYGTERKEGIRPYFTVFGSGQININTAPMPILMALADEMTEDIAGEMDKFRRDEANRWALADKNWFKRIWPHGTPLPESAMTVASSAFSVFMKASLRESVKEIHAVISRPAESSAFISYWREM
jgi:general secretion pathway protein K